MPNQYNEDQKALTTASILESLLQTMREKAFKNITVSEICKKAGVSRMAFYRHYNDLEEVLSIHIEERFEKFFEEAADMDLSSSYNTSKLIFEYMLDEKDFYSTIVSSGYTETLHQYYENFTIYLFRALDFGYKLDENDSNYYASYRAGGIVRLIIAWINNDCNESPEHMAQLLTEFDI